MSPLPSAAVRSSPYHACSLLTCPPFLLKPSSLQHSRSPTWLPTMAAPLCRDSAPPSTVRLFRIFRSSPFGFHATLFLSFLLRHFVARRLEFGCLRNYDFYGAFTTFRLRRYDSNKRLVDGFEITDDFKGRCKFVITARTHIGLYAPEVQNGIGFF